MAKTLHKIYSDIDLTFARNPITGDISFSYDEMAIIRSVRNLIQTNFYERLMQPDVGSNVEFYLFELNTMISASSLETEVSNVINNYEPRARLLSVHAILNDDQNSFYLEIKFEQNIPTNPYFRDSANEYDLPFA